MSNNIVAIIGRPNVGKSTLFNRMLRKKVSIVENKSGVTRDRIYSSTEWLTKKFVLIDTGGITSKNMTFSEQINAQVNIAIDEADIILFVLSYKEGLTDEDKHIAKKLHKKNKKIILVVNKYDKKVNENDIYDYMVLGFDLPILVSSEHGIGIGDLLDKIISLIDYKKIQIKKNVISFAIIGKPNSGKSSLVNSILNEDRVIVSHIPGSTTDSIDTEFTYNKKKYVVTDTAGIIKKSKLYEKLEKFSFLHSIKSIEKSDIIILLIDGSEKITNLDTIIGGIPFETTKPVIIVINKIDLFDDKNEEYYKWEDEIKKRFKYLKYAYCVFVSAIKKNRINKLLDTINLVHIAMNKRINTSILNEVLIKAQLANQSPHFKGGRLKIYYSSQPSSIPPTFILFVNNKSYAHFSYIRYIENQIRNSFNFKGVPIKLILRSKK